MAHRLPPRPAPTTFRPRFTLMLLYVVAFFLLYCLLIAAPDLMRIGQTTPTGPEQRRAAEEAAYQAVRPHLLPAFAAAVLTVAAGAYTRKLPGLRA